MHLIELIAELEAVKSARGNVKLVDVIVMAAGDQKPLADFADRPAARAQAPELAIDVTGMSDDQVEEILAENPSAKLVRRPPEPNDSPSEPCNVVDVAKGACTLPIGHAGDHEWEHPEQQLDETAKEVAGELADARNTFAVPGTLSIDFKSSDEPVVIGPVSTEVGDGAEVIDPKPATAADLGEVMETAAAKLPVRCEVWDGRGHQCIDTDGHEGAHDFTAGKFALTSTSSEPGDAGLPAAVQQPEQE